MISQVFDKVWTSCKEHLAGKRRQQRLLRETGKEVSLHIRTLKDLETEIAAYLIRLKQGGTLTFHGAHLFSINAAPIERLQRKLTKHAEDDEVCTYLRHGIEGLRRIADRLTAHTRHDLQTPFPNVEWEQTLGFVLETRDVLSVVQRILNAEMKQRRPKRQSREGTTHAKHHQRRR